MEKLQTYRLMDDDFMTKVFEDVECTELLLQIIMEKPDLKVLDVHTQHYIKNLQGRSARLDIYATDSGNKEYNVEVEKEHKNAHVKRARYNSSIMDANITNPGDQYELLSETYVIFITDFDMWGDGLPIYHIDRMIQENGRLFRDGAHIIYVNGLIKNQTPLGMLMHDFSCVDPDDMNYKVLADRVKYLKEDKMEIAKMEAAVEELYQDMIAQYGEQVYAAVWEEKAEIFEEEIKATIEERVTAELRVKLEERVTAELREKLEERVTAELRAKLEERVTAELRVKLKEEKTEIFEEELRAEIEKRIEAEIRAESEEKVRAKIQVEVEESVKAEVRAEIEEKVKAEVRAEIEEELKQR